VGNNPINYVDPTGHKPDEMSDADYLLLVRAERDRQRPRESAIAEVKETLAKLPTGHDPEMPGVEFHVSDFAAEIYDASTKYGVPVVVIAAVMQQESFGGNPLANNSASYGPGDPCCEGGKGLMQVDLGEPPGTMGRYAGWWDEIPGKDAKEKTDFLYNPANNIDFAVRMVLKPAWDASGGNIRVTLQAYNGGGDPNYTANVNRFYRMMTGVDL